MDNNIENINIIIGKNIKKYRTSKKMTRKKLAEKLGISPQYLYNIENGQRRINAEKLYAISKILNVSIEKFFKE
ncbi:MAG: helix-turn-helix domain-containing protein [Thermovenabulum sp.]|uniref:helix-turn-helix domain-containing protein n=1 Tax=Thermovenabulum sp. TaxID=3100335 RepID=UPI003C7DFB7B